jgi:hypothetical protein
MPNKQNLLLWADALESGTYTQATGILLRFNNNSPTKYAHCSLGVACEVYMKNAKDPQVAREGKGYVENDVFYFGCLPFSVAAWLGVDIDPFLLTEGDGTKRSAVYVNDQMRLPFSRIAELVRRLANEESN